MEGMILHIMKIDPLTLIDLSLTMNHIDLVSLKGVTEKVIVTFTTRITGIRDKEIVLGKDMIETEMQLALTVIMIMKEGHVDIQVIDLKTMIMIMNIENAQESVLLIVFIAWIMKNLETHYDDEYDHRKSRQQRSREHRVEYSVDKSKSDDPSKPNTSKHILPKIINQRNHH